MKKLIGVAAALLLMAIFYDTSQFTATGDGKKDWFYAVSNRIVKSIIIVEHNRITWGYSLSVDTPAGGIFLMHRNDGTNHFHCYAKYNGEIHPLTNTD